MKLTERFTKDLDAIKKKFVDDISKDIFEARFEYLLYRNIDKLRDDMIEIIKKSNQKFDIEELDELYVDGVTEGIVIFGIGINGAYTYKVIENSKYSNAKILFCDNNSNMWGKEYMGRSIISPYDLEDNYRNYICVIGSHSYLYGIWNQLLTEEFPKKNILYPSKGVLYGVCGWQYFDYFQPKADECFLDGGVFDGETSEDFVRWTQNQYATIYGFEANPRCFDKCKRLYDSKLKNAELYDLCLWNEKSTLRFSTWYASASKVTNEGEIEVAADSIDDVLVGKRVSFIKMDIEGSELKALAGAERTIKAHRPRMAISIYHKPEDIIEIPSKLLELNENYRFAIRQYTSIGDETVLYAF